MSELTPSARRALRARAHHLNPVVAIGQNGLTPAVLHEIDVALLKHELIKVRVTNPQRAAREASSSLICKELECASVQHLGRIFVLYRENPDAAKTAALQPDTRSFRKTGERKPVRLKTAPRTPLDPVRERRRATQVGLPVSGKGRRGAARHQPADLPLSDGSRTASKTLAPARRRRANDPATPDTSRTASKTLTPTRRRRVSDLATPDTSRTAGKTLAPTRRRRVK